MAKKNEKELAELVVKLFREGKLNFSYFYNPLFTFCEYDTRDDHEFIAEYNSLTIRLRRRYLMVDGKETTDKESFNISLTKELKKIYSELYCKHEPEIKRVLEAQKVPPKRDTKLENTDKSDILEKLQ